MKVQLTKNQCCDCGQAGWVEAGISDGGVGVEVPHAIIKEWRECWDRIAAFEKYFDESAQPQIDEADRLRREQWRRDHPETPQQKEIREMLVRMWSRNLIGQVKWFSRWSNTNKVLADDLTKAPMDEIRYDTDQKKN
jgi:hypothetical protein